MQQPTSVDQFMACLLGGAVGDALGAPIAGMSLAEIRQSFGKHGVQDVQPAYGRPGTITDCTQMTLFTAEGLLRADNRHRDRGLCNVWVVLYHAYLRWLITQGETFNVWSDVPIEDGWLLSVRDLHARRTPGTTCIQALKRRRRNMGDSPLAAEPINGSKGSAALTRIAPVGLSAAEPFTLACELAALTHGHPTAYLTAGFFAASLSGLLQGMPLEAAIERASSQLSRHNHFKGCRDAVDAALRQARKAPPTPESIEKLGKGWDADEALAIALYCALVAESFEHGVLLAVNHGGASNRTGSLSGQILGLRFGRTSILEHWLAPLELRTIVEDVASDMVRHFGTEAQMGPEIYDYEKYPTY